MKFISKGLCDIRGKRLYNKLNISVTQSLHHHCQLLKQVSKHLSLHKIGKYYILVNNITLSKASGVEVMERKQFIKYTTRWREN